jgi:glycosyltransferase involved in cell wall biosynthesis
MRDLTVVIPVYKENFSIVKRLHDEVKDLGANVIVVDDGNTMNLPKYISHITYPKHVGYGNAIKKGIEAADTDIICVIDGDGQHQPEDVQKLYLVYKMSNSKMTVGCRWNLEEKPVRWWGRKIINFFASCLAGHYLLDLNSGMRVFDRKLAIGYSPILCDTFSFTPSLTMSMVTDGHKISWFPIDVLPRAHGKSRVKVVKDGFITLYYIVWIGIAIRTRGLRAWFRTLGR